MSAERMKIYDSTGKEIANIAKDRTGATRLILTPGISSDTHKQVQDILFGAGNTTDPQFENRLKTAYEGHGFGFESDEQIELRITKNIDFIHESNLIEDVTEIDKKLITERYKKQIPLGCVGAWLVLEGRAKEKSPISGEDVMKMQLLLTDEQSDYGHSLDKKHRGVIRGDYDWVRVGGRIIPPPSPVDYANYFTRLNTGLEQLHPKNVEDVLRYSAKMHLEYEIMHPFADGNGRTGRNIANYILKYFNLPVLIFTSQDKEKYYQGFDVPTHLESSAMENYFIVKYREQNPKFLGEISK